LLPMSTRAWTASRIWRLLRTRQSHS